MGPFGALAVLDVRAQDGADAVAQLEPSGPVLGDVAQGDAVDVVFAAEFGKHDGPEAHGALRVDGPVVVAVEIVGHPLADVCVDPDGGPAEVLGKVEQLGGALEEVADGVACNGGHRWSPSMWNGV